MSGATEQALAFATRLCDAVARRAPDAPARVTLIHRRDAFDADDDTVAAFRTARAPPARCTSSPASRRPSRSTATASPR